MSSAPWVMLTMKGPMERLPYFRWQKLIAWNTLIVLRACGLT